MIMKAFSELLDYYHHTAMILMMMMIITWASTAMLFTISLATARFFTSTLSTVTFGDDYNCGYDDNDNDVCNVGDNVGAVGGAGVVGVTIIDGNKNVSKQLLLFVKCYLECYD